MKIYCEKCRYIDWIPVDGPVQKEARCKKVKGHDFRPTPIKHESKPLTCNPYIDNLHNNCPYYEEKQKLLDKIFNWRW